jgi:hypothetical protein
MVRTSRLAARLLASADTKQLEKGLYDMLQTIGKTFFFRLWTLDLSHLRDK